MITKFSGGERAGLNPEYDMVAGVKDKLGVLWRNEKNLNSVLKDVLNVSVIDYLNVVLRLTKSGT